MNEMKIPHCRLNFLENFAEAGGFWLIAFILVMWHMPPLAYLRCSWMLLFIVDN